MLVVRIEGIAIGGNSRNPKDAGDKPNPEYPVLPIHVGNLTRNFGRRQWRVFSIRAKREFDMGVGGTESLIEPTWGFRAGMDRRMNLKPLGAGKSVMSRFPVLEMFAKFSDRKRFLFRRKIYVPKTGNIWGNFLGMILRNGPKINNLQNLAYFLRNLSRLTTSASPWGSSATASSGTEAPAPAASSALVPCTSSARSNFNPNCTGGSA